MPQAPNIVATWSEDSNVYLWNVNDHIFALDKPPTDPSKLNKISPLRKIPHSTEGFAMDWSPLKAGRLITGDGNKNIFLTEVITIFLLSLVYTKLISRLCIFYYLSC